MSYSYDRTAAAKFNPATIKAITKMTDENDNARALVAGAKMLGLRLLEKKLTLVAELQDLEAHLPTGLKTYRDSLYDTLMDSAKSALSEDEYKQFYGAY